MSIFGKTVFKKNNFLFFMIAGLWGIVFSTSHGNATSVNSDPTNTSQVMAGAFPDVGKVAYWGHHPKKPDQKILFVPSIHSLNLRFIKADLAKVMKGSDILIVEHLEPRKTLRWNDRKMIAARLVVPKKLREYGLLRNESLLAGGHPWSEKLTPAAKDYLKTNLEPHLKKHGVALDNLHPSYIQLLLARVSDSKLFNTGMDKQIFRYFDLNQKPVLGLETMKEAYGIADPDSAAHLKKSC